MTNFLLHGENVSQSRTRLNELVAQAKQKGHEIIRIDAKGAPADEILTSSRAQSLLGRPQLTVIENLSVKKDSFSLLKRVLEQSPSPVVVWEAKKLTPAQIRKLPEKLRTEEFKVPASIFKFLDALSPKNTTPALRLLQQAKETSPSEFLLFMLGTRVRRLIWAKEDPETLRLPDWQKKRLIAQAEKWQLTQLYTLHTRLLELDRRSKKSELPEDLPASLDLLVAEI